MATKKPTTKKKPARTEQDRMFVTDDEGEILWFYLHKTESECRTVQHYDLSDCDDYDDEYHETFETVGSVRLEQLPGCCGVAVLHNLSVTYECLGRGLSKRMLELALECAYDYDYTYIIATDILSNTRTQKLFKHFGFTELSKFENVKSGNDVGVYGLHIRERSN